MTYDVARQQFTREKFYLVELHAPYCGLTYGVAPCTASGPTKCYNTFTTCQDVPNFTPSDKVYRFCSARSPIPPGVPNLTMASVQSVNFTAPSIDVTGGLGVRASVAITLADGPSGDIGIDKYISDRTYIPHKQGTYWGKWRARNPYYEDLRLTVWSGFLNTDGSFSYDNMQRREYILTGLQQGNGKAKLDGRDPLKLTEALKAQYPAKSTGVLAAELALGVTSVSLQPAGVGDAEYPASGFVRVSSEVMGYTRTGDALTLTRAQYNTLEAVHAAGDAVQFCPRENDRPDAILARILTVGANVPTSYIPTVEWSAEASANYPGDIDRLITEPESVESLIKEICGETCPSYLYWDERSALIRWEAVRQPPVDIDTLNDRDHLTGDLVTADQLKLRASRVIVYLGQIDPTKKKDETSNYALTHARVDLQAESAAGSPAIKTIYSRWLNNFNKAGAVLLTTRLGRRFAKAPQLINFQLTSKDTSYWMGSACAIEHPELQTVEGGAGIVPAQIVSVAEKPGGYTYQALEFFWGDALPDDAEDGIDLVIIGGDVNNINLRTIYDSLYPEPTEDSVVRFIIDTGVEVGSTSVATYSVNTGSWPAGMAPIELGVRGFMQGKGGNGGVDSDGQNGGPCLIMNFDVTVLFITGRIAGGGGGGGASFVGSLSAHGGGGAGIVPGLNGGSPFASRDAGGNGESVGEGGAFANGGDGGDPGEDGEIGISSDGGGFYVGGLAGAAIDTNGYTLTIEDGGSNILGAII
jgi:hypothetical protein